MKTYFLALFLGSLASLPARAEDAAVDGDEVTVLAAIVPGHDEQGGSPVPVPPLQHYAALWTKSMFTTHDLPMPEAPAGPGFADQLVLAGTYEVDGAVAAVILDKMTSQIMEARIGSENEAGIRIKSVDLGDTAEGTRIQLQKGTQFGWVGFADAAAGGAAPVPRATSPERIPGLSTRSLDPPGVQPPGMSPGAAAAIQAAAAANAAPPPASPMPDVVNPPAMIDDIPLPPQ